MGCGASQNHADAPLAPSMPDRGHGHGENKRESESCRSSGKPPQRPSLCVSIEELEGHDQASRKMSRGSKAGGSGRKPRSTSVADEEYEKLCLLWPTFSQACFEGSLKAASAGILPRVDIVNRMDYLWMAIPRIALTDMLLRSMTQDGLRTRDAEVLSSHVVPPHALPLYIELCTIKHTMAASLLSQLEAATLRRVVVHGGKHAKSREWLDALCGMVVRQSQSSLETTGYSSEEDQSQEDNVSMTSAQSQEASFLSQEVGDAGGDARKSPRACAVPEVAAAEQLAAAERPSETSDGGGRGGAMTTLAMSPRLLRFHSLRDVWHEKARQVARGRRRGQLVLQLAARCGTVIECVANSSRFSLDVSKVLSRVDEALAPMHSQLQALAPHSLMPRPAIDTGSGGAAAACEVQLPAPSAEFDATVIVGARHRWCVGNMVGFGAYGKVFAAWLYADGGDSGRKIALKEVAVDAQHAGRVEREISILSALSHPHIITLLGSERTETMLFILMEFASQGSLAGLCRHRKGLSEKLSRNFVTQMLLGLDYLHQNSIIHRDIKGANCLLFPAPLTSSMHGGDDDAHEDEASTMLLKLADFGASRMFDYSANRGAFSPLAERLVCDASQAGSSSPESRLMPASLEKKQISDKEVETQQEGCPQMLGTSGVRGTTNWMAPEIILNQKPGLAADIWSLGATTSEILTGKTPWDGLPQISVMYKISMAGELPERPETCSAALQDFLGQCFRKDAETRMTAKQLLSHKWIRPAAALARARALRLITQEIEGLSDAILTSPEFHLQRALRGPFARKGRRSLDLSVDEPGLIMNAQDKEGWATRIPSSSSSTTATHTTASSSASPSTVRMHLNHLPPSPLSSLVLSRRKSSENL